MQVAEININQREEEGVDVRAFRDAFAALTDFDEAGKVAALIRLIDNLEAAPIRADFGYIEPNDLLEIRKLATPLPELPECCSDDEIKDKILGGWLGRASGCLLGKPIEGTPLGYKKNEVRKYLESRDLWPITGYFDRDEPMNAIDPTLPQPFPGMTRDDDIDYVLLNLLVLENHGFDWTSDKALSIWSRHLSYDFIYAAGKAAYRNYCCEMRPPKTATWGNPCRQSLGAMIRCDTWGWVSPGDPVKAAEMAYRDGIISQTTNGIYSGMFFAAMIAAAFVEDNINQLIEVGLSQVPETSRFAEAMRYTVAAWEEHKSSHQAIDAVYERYSQLYFNHAIINACIVLIGLFSGAGDFEKTIIDTVTCGFDTDCTGATAGSICGVISGAALLPAKWVEPLQDTYETFLAGLGVQKISNLAERTARWAVRK